MSEPRVLSCPSRLDISAVRGLKDVLENALEADEAVSMDLSEVIRLDAAGAQLLLAASKWATQNGRTLQLLQPSEAACEALDLLGMREALMAPTGEETV